MNWWGRQGRASSVAVSGQAPADGFWPLCIVGQGMCCALGFDARAVTAAVSARMTQFSETAFRCDGSPVIGAVMPGVGLLGTGRWRVMLEQVCKEALEGTVGRLQAPPPMVLLCAQPAQPGIQKAQAEELLAHLQEQGLACTARSTVLPNGKAGIAQALLQAAQWLRQDAIGTSAHGDVQAGTVLVAAVDSYLTASAIDAIHAQGRLKLPEVSDGLMPGEGAAAVLLAADSSDSETLQIAGIGQGEPTDPVNGDAPLRGKGLTKAVRAAAAAAGCKVADLQFHVSGATGESRGMKEIALALSQALEHRVPQFDHLPVAAWLGETGSAAPVLALAWLRQSMHNPLGPGQHGLLHFGNDSGERTALVVRAKVAAQGAS